MTKRSSSGESHKNNNNNHDSSKSPTSTAPVVVPSLRSSARMMEEDTEFPQFLLRLAPRIRRFESNTVTALLQAMEDLLLQLQEVRSSSSSSESASSSNAGIISKMEPASDTTTTTTEPLDTSPTSTSGVHGKDTTTSNASGSTATTTVLSKLELDLLIMFGHCMRGLAILGRGADVESIFARVAIMPLIRSKVSMGRLDQGGSRGECTGLFSLLDEMATVIQQTYGPVLCLGETMFHIDPEPTTPNEGDDDNALQMTTTALTKKNLSPDVDLITAGVWVPIVTALMADSAIKMAIFSPGIASVLQANYLALDEFLSELASRLLLRRVQNEKKMEEENGSLDKNGNNQNNPQQLAFVCEDGGESDDFLALLNFFMTKERINRAQDRIYTHPKTAEFSKRWNLPIYYQLRFGESCTRLNKAIDQTKREGWIAQVCTASEDRTEQLKNQCGFELSLFLEVYDIMSDLWRPDVILRPLAKRFLRGSVQLVGRTISFIRDSMEGKISFGHEETTTSTTEPNTSNDAGQVQEGASSLNTSVHTAFPTRNPYCWGDSEDDVAAVAWELAILESSVRHDYVERVCEALHDEKEQARVGGDMKSQEGELRSLVSEIFCEVSDQIHPVIDKAWNEIIVKLLTTKCSGPLSAVKGVAVMYRMTNRPPPTQPSSFVGTIFRPLIDFGRSYRNRTPERIGAKWKHQIVVTVSDRYAAAVDELLTTVQRTEVALKNRKARRIAAGGMSDGEKLKLQLYLDYKSFRQSVQVEVGVDPATVIGLSKLQELTAEGEGLEQSRQEQ